MRLVAPEPMARRLQAMARSGMRHRVTLETLVSVQLPNHEYVDSWTEEPEQRGLLMMGPSKLTQVAAASGVKADGTLRLVLGAPAFPGQRAMVRGTTKGLAWQHLVELTSGTDLTNRLFGLVTVVDVDLNQG